MYGKVLKLALLAAGLFIGVESQERYQVAHKWRQRQMSLAQSRWPAQDVTPSCKGELFTVEELRREAAHYEALLEGEAKPTGNWRHLQLSELPLAQARFLQALGNRVGDLTNPASLDVSGCRDVPCIVNAVYGPGASVEGWAVYVWWLKMGSILNLTNSIYVFTPTLPIQWSTPGSYDGVAYPVASYLFSRDELYAFWRLTHMLPTVFKTITKLKMISRVPRGAPRIVGYEPNTCGLASSVGYITLKDGCLELGDSERTHTKDRGAFYHLVVHEMVHMLDNKFNTRPEEVYYSLQDEWKTMGQWRLTETNTPAGVVRTWISGLPESAFVTGYARGNPIEHFAEVGAYYRYNGEATERAGTPEIYRKMKTMVYENDEFTPAGWIAYLRRPAEEALAPLVLQATHQCYEGNETYPGPGALSALELPVTIDENKRRCLYVSRTQLLARGLADLRISSVDACSYLRRPEREQQLSRELHDWITQQMGQHVRRVLEDEQYFQILGEFYQTISQGLVPAQMITDCYGETDERRCYEGRVNEYITEVVPADHARVTELRADLARRFLDTYPFDRVRADMIKTFQDYLATQSTVLIAGAVELWEECANVAISNEVAPRSGRFSVGTGWMNSAQYNCLNATVEESLAATIARMRFEGDTLDSEQERRILGDLAAAIYLGEIRRLYLEAKALELGTLTEARGSEAALSAYLVGDFSWLRAFDTDFRRQCLARALSVIPSELRYHSQAEREGLVAPSCARVAGSAELQNHRRAHPELSTDFHTRAYLTEVERLSRERVTVCERAHPYRGLISRVRNRGRRSDCFREGWSEINQRLLSQSQTQYNLTLPGDVLARMEREGRLIRERYRSELIGEILPDL